MNEGDEWRFSVFCKSNAFHLKTEKLGVFFVICLLVLHMRHN